MDAMKNELQMWRHENRQHAEALQKEQRSVWSGKVWFIFQDRFLFLGEGRVLLALKSEFVISHFCGLGIFFAVQIGFWSVKVWRSFQLNFTRCTWQQRCRHLCEMRGLNVLLFFPSRIFKEQTGLWTGTSMRFPNHKQLSVCHQRLFCSGGNNSGDCLCMV